jgi:exonuclease SbcC
VSYVKVLFFTDPHLTAKTPVGRLDNFAVAAYKKFIEITSIIMTKKPDIVVIGGDLFNTAKISFKFAGMMAKIIRSWSVPVYVVPGSHDLYGYNLDTIDQTMLGMYENTGVIKLISRNNPIELEYKDINGDDRIVEILGEEHTITSTFDYRRPRSPKVDYQIQVIHDMVMDKPYLPDVPHIQTKDIVTEADLVLCGHYHPGWPTHTIGNTTFANPGSLLRMDRSDHNKTAVPKVMMIDITDLSNVKLEDIPLTVAAPGTSVFDYKSKQQATQQQQLLNNFKASLQSTAVLQNTVSIPQMLTIIGQQIGADQSIITTAQKYLHDAEVNQDEACPAIQGYIEKTADVWLTEAHIVNFQSHKDTTINFVQGLNALIGESNQGKTAILRAINWALYNEPKGSDFIRTGESKCKVTLKFSDGSVIERERDRSSSGTYRVTDANGKTTEYKGFGNDIPIEVANTHQMPKVYLAKDYQENLNVASQLDPPFLIGTTGANRAAAIGRLIGVQIVDGAISQASKNIKALQKDIKKLEEDHEKNLNDLKSFDDMDLWKSFIDLCEFYVSFKETTEKELEVAIECDNGLNACRKELAEAEAELKSLPDYDRQLPVIEEALKDVAFMKFMEELISQHIDVANARFRGEMTLGWIPKQEEYQPLIDEADQLLKELKQAQDFRTERIRLFREIQVEEDSIKNIDADQIASLVTEAETLLSEMKQAQEFAEGLQKLTSDIRNEESFQENLEDLEVEANMAVIDIEKQFKEYLASIGVCPTCGTKLDKDHIKHIVGG